MDPLVGPVGVEITAPQAVPLERLNWLLAELGGGPNDGRGLQACSRRVSGDTPPQDEKDPIVREESSGRSQATRHEVSHVYVDCLSLLVSHGS